MIQIISYNIKKYENYSKNLFHISELDNFQSFDNYDITVVDVSEQKLWYNDDDSTKSINRYKDLKSINCAIQKNKKSKIIILFPQNIDFYYNYRYAGDYKKYRENIKIKDMRKSFVEIISSNLIDIGTKEINFGTSYTIINNEKIPADFSFLNIMSEDIVLTSENQNDVVAIKNGKAIITTLNIMKEEEMTNLLKNIFTECFDKKTPIPEWMKEVNFYTDVKLKENMLEIDEKIDKLEREKIEIENLLTENSEYKSILYETGDELAKQVNKMLSVILNYDMSNYEDIYEEDGLIKLEDVTFVIETKGLNNEISGHNISDACNHLIIYEDKLEANNIVEFAKCLFIVAYQRNKNINERAEIKERVETIAKANKTLIIDTRTFLKIFEDFLNKKISTENIKELLKENIGILKY